MPRQNDKNHRDKLVKLRHPAKGFWGPSKRNYEVNIEETWKTLEKKGRCGPHVFREWEWERETSVEWEREWQCQCVWGIEGMGYTGYGGNVPRVAHTRVP